MTRKPDHYSWWSTLALHGRVTLLLFLAVVASCTPEQAGEQPVDAATELTTPSEEGVAEQGPPELARFLPEEMRRSTRAETFPHEAHVQIDCAGCHAVAEGHTSHEDVACAACHRSSALSTVGSLTPQECQACHHAASRPQGCEGCHDPPGVLNSLQEMGLDVWSSPRTRELAFDHAMHESTSCGDCHRSRPELTAESCATCHDDHHTGQVRCAACHAPAPEAAHGVDVHLTCAGVGCHSAPAIERIAETRAVCLACHQDQEEHEPAGECIACHKVRGESGSGHSLGEDAVALAWERLSRRRW